MSKSKGVKKTGDKSMSQLVDGGTKSRHFKRNNAKDEALQKFDEIESVTIDADFSTYKNAGRAINTVGLRTFKDANDKVDVEEKIQMFEKCLDWLDEDDDGKDCLYIGDIIAYLAITRRKWDYWATKDERIKELQEVIKEKLQSRVHYMAAKSKINPVFGMFSLKNTNSDQFKDKHEVEQTNTHRINSIQIVAADDTKELGEPEIREIEENIGDEQE